MTRSKKIGYFHATLTTAWFSIAANDTSHVINGLLGDAGSTMISLLFLLPLSLPARSIIGFPLFPSMPEHFIRMSVMGVVVVLNGLLVGYFIDRVLTWLGIPDRSKHQQRTELAEQTSTSNGE
jgi:hypothetical protein